MEKMFVFIIIKINVPVIFHDNGYELRDYLTEKYDIADHLYDVSYDRLIIAIPDHGKGLGVSMNEFREAVKEFVLAKIYTVSVHVDFENQQITNIKLEGDTHYE